MVDGSSTLPFSNIHYTSLRNMYKEWCCHVIRFACCCIPNAYGQHSVALCYVVRLDYYEMKGVMWSLLSLRDDYFSCV